MSGFKECLLLKVLLLKTMKLKILITITRILQRAFQHTRWNAYSFAAINTVTDLGPIIVIGVGSYLAITGSITVGTLAAFVGYLEQLFGPLRRLVSSFTTLTQSFASMDRVFQLMDEDYDIKNGIGAQPIKISKGQIDLKHVSFKYNENEKEVLHDINLTINKGETVAFVGMSGGGKSTLINLIPRFYDVTQGEILIDHHNVKDFLTGSLRNQIGLVQQDNILFLIRLRRIFCLVGLMRLMMKS